MKRILFLLIIINWIVWPSMAQKNKTTLHSDLVEWMSLEQALEKQKEQPKKIFVDIYTDWCGWCKVMSKKTFSNPVIAEYINRNYYPVRYDAENKDTIQYLGKTYLNKTPNKRRSINDLTLVLTQNRPSYPTIAYLDETGKLIQAVPGFMDAEKIEPILIYITENAYMSSDYQNFFKAYTTCYKDSNFVSTNKIDWLSFEEAEKRIAKQPKPILVDLHSDWSNTSKIMEMTTFPDSLTAQYINENFYPVRFNPIRKDSIHFFGKTYYNHSKQHPFHDLAVILCNTKISVPAIAFLNHKGQLISTVRGYRSPIEAEPLLKFFAEAFYTKQNWLEYLKTFKSKRPQEKELQQRKQ